MGMIQKASYWVPHEFKFKLLQRQYRRGFLYRIIIGDGDGIIIGCIELLLEMDLLRKS